MASKQAKQFRKVVKVIGGVMLSPAIPVPAARWLMSKFGGLQKPANGVSVSQVKLGGVPTEKLRPGTAASAAGAVLYFHGGAYVVGSPVSHRLLTSCLAQASGMTVFAADYRLAPEHPFPAAVEDAVAAYRALLSEGYRPENIVIGGDSAGGGLTLAAAVSLRDAKLPQPAALVLLSPWADLTLSGPTMKSKAKVDPMLTEKWLRKMADTYLHGKPAKSPTASPLFANLTGLPPMLIQVGSDEVLLSDSERLAENARAAGVKVDYHLYEDLWHVFQASQKQVPEADEALAEIVGFIRKNVK